MYHHEPHENRFNEGTFTLYFGNKNTRKFNIVFHIEPVALRYSVQKVFL